MLFVYTDGHSGLNSIQMFYVQAREPQICPTLTKGSKWLITQIWESDVFRLDLAYSTSNPNFEQKHSSMILLKEFKSIYNDIALMSMYTTDTFCSFTRIVIFKSCFLLSEYGRDETEIYIFFGVRYMWIITM